MNPKSTKKPRTTRGNAKGTETFSFGSGNAYVKPEEIAADGLPFDIPAIEFQAERGFEGRDRWALTIKRDGHDPEILTLGSNPGRDEQLQGAQAFLERGGSLRNIRLVLRGNTYYLNDGDR
jgi:hypothetical protein